MNTKRSLIRRGAAVVTAGAALAVLAACGSDGGSPAGHDGHGSSTSSASASQGRHNAADVAFAQGMVPHHRQAVEMAGLAPGRAHSAEVKKLAEDIKKAQDPEIRTLSGWLTSWGETVPSEGAMDHSTHDMGSMMTSDDMEKLEKASGTAFDTAFTEMMIEHHEGAVEMARTEQADGSYAPAKKMAGRIITSQTAEIARMKELLGED
ncbi:lipoprotein [Streptomyces fumigatiscleroticus]|nr:lipoprotein [Streptomyces fumigatiscleroticus]